MIGRTVMCRWVRDKSELEARSQQLAAAKQLPKSVAVSDGFSSTIASWNEENPAGGHPRYMGVGGARASAAGRCVFARATAFPLGQPGPGGSWAGKAELGCET